MVDIHHESFCEAPLDVAFAYVDNYRNAPKWMFGLTGFTPSGPQDQGLGAVFDGTFAVKPIKLSSSVRVTRWRHNEIIAFESTKGFTNWSTWRFSAPAPTRTSVQVVFGYELPGGLAGKALGRAMEPVVALSVRHSDAALRRQIEQHWAATRTR